MKITLALLLFLTSSGILFAQDNLDGSTIFDRVMQKYSSCRTFSCGGSSHETCSVPIVGNDDRTFLIRFARPSQIRVDWTKARFMGLGTVKAAIYTDDGKFYSISDILGGPKPYPSISEAIGVEAGVSGGISYLIPPLLLGEQGYLSYWTITRGPDSTVSGAACYSIALETKGFGIYTFDIAKANFSILRATQVSDAAVLNAQRERAHKENPAWFNDPPGTPKPFISSKTIVDFTDVIFDALIANADFKPAKK
jgi:hypothetical protein